MPPHAVHRLPVSFSAFAPDRREQSTREGAQWDLAGRQERRNAARDNLMMIHQLLKNQELFFLETELHNFINITVYIQKLQEQP